MHTDSPSSVVSASFSRRGAKNEPKVAKTHSSVGMLHLLTKDYVTCACTYIQTLPPLLCQQVVVEGVQRASPRWPRHILLSVCYIIIFNERLCDMCLYMHTDSPSSVVSASFSRRGAKNEPKVAKTHSSVGMSHLNEPWACNCYKK